MTALHETAVLAVQIYFVAAIGYNLISQIKTDLGKRPLAPTEPSFGLMMMASLLAIWSLSEHIDRLLWGGVVVTYLYMILRFGIVRHLTGYSDDAYASRLSWGCAIGINVFGVASLAAAMILQMP